MKFRIKPRLEATILNFGYFLETPNWSFRSRVTLTFLWPIRVVTTANSTVFYLLLFLYTFFWQIPACFNKFIQLISYCVPDVVLLVFLVPEKVNNFTLTTLHNILLT